MAEWYRPCLESSVTRKRVSVQVTLLPLNEKKRLSRREDAVRMVLERIHNEENSYCVSTVFGATAANACN
jgi:hypothetical protein